MADDINSSASFGQSKNDSEELPIIVAQRFLNIFRQLHIFSDERREAFNKMLLELPPEVKSIFQSLPGGTPLQEYMEDLEQKSKGLEPVAHHSHQKNSNILQEALSENRSTGGTTGGEGIINGDNFARILASSLAQSNAEIIRELQNTRPAAAGIEGGSGTGGGFDGPMKLVADESFTNIISKALAEAIENSEKKRLEDNKMIARSFTELQENLTKLIEQSSQLKFISGGDGKTAAAPIQMKGLVDDLVKAQSAFLKETTKSQKEELSSIISTAIKESQKVSTQALIESFKKISEEKIPTPITYAASSPKGQPAMESVEQALKAQGKEFSSIISMALKESQKNSAQTIIETLETLKKDSTVSAGGQNNLKVEEIMRMQANLFRDIARAQNQEFSALISSALKESQRQSTEAIIAALSQLQTAPVQTVAVPVPMPAVNREIPAALQPAVHERPAAPQMPEPTVSTPMIDKYLDGVDEEEETEEKANAATIEETPKKKKKKKKKKNREAENGTAGAVDDESDEMPAGEEKTRQETKTETPTAGGAEKEKAPAESKVSAPAADETPKAAEAGKPAAGKAPTGKTEKEDKKAAREAAAEKTTEEKAQPAEEKAKPAESAPKADKTATSKPEPAAAAEEGKEPQISPMLRKLMTISTAFADVQDIKDSDPGDDWGWGFGGSDSEKTDNAVGGSDGYGFETDDDGYSAATTADAGDGEDWEWEYEEVPADAEMSGEEGEDWEWEYEEVPADAEASGEEGEDWEWEYEEVPADAETAGEENGDWEWEYENTPAAAAETEDEVYEEAAAEDSSLSPDEFAQTSEIVVDSLPQFVLLGLEDEKFRDPYIENSDNIG